jgi:hypothetical protein
MDLHAQMEFVQHHHNIMTLPFQKNDLKRNYQCFVCGKRFDIYDEYSNHIITSHEEGREFVVCPLSRCKAPVRDIRTHFASKHKDEKIPKNGQMKATIWKDINNKTGKVTQRKPKFREGYFISGKNQKEMHYRSGYECEVYECLESILEVIKYDVEPFKVDYIFEGDRHEYNPDLSIFFSDGRVEIWEIKPANQTQLPKNHAKWAACQSYCEARGWSFMVMTEVGIGKLKKAARDSNRL